MGNKEGCNIKNPLLICIINKIFINNKNSLGLYLKVGYLLLLKV